MNKILIGFTATATAVFGVYFKLNSFIFMPIFGLNNGMVPIIAYNYGAQKHSRIIKTMKLSITYAVSIMIFGLLIFQFFPTQLLGMFNASSDMIAIGVPALRIISISFIAAGFCIVTLSILQALGQGIYSLVTSISRQMIILLPVAFIQVDRADENRKEQKGGIADEVGDEEIAHTRKEQLYTVVHAAASFPFASSSRTSKR